MDDIIKLILIRIALSISSSVLISIVLLSLMVIVERIFNPPTDPVRELLEEPEESSSEEADEKYKEPSKG